ncbi:MAG: zinc-ribbon domain-containing protein [Dehalococcoidia bacterium]|nr:zinc-ribbon domain-containing protein [Dehalococcoidia bacterium]
MAYCANCGAQVQGDTKFCPACGAQAGSTPQQQQHQPSSQYQQPHQQQSQQGGLGFLQNTADETGGMDPADIEKNKTIAGLAYFLFFLPLISCPESKYGRFHANQGLILLILSIACGIVSFIISAILPWRLSVISTIIYLIVSVVVIILGVTGLINGFNGRAKELPVIGKFRILK